MNLYFVPVWEGGGEGGGGPLDGVGPENREEKKQRTVQNTEYTCSKTHVHNNYLCTYDLYGPKVPVFLYGTLILMGANP